MAKSLFFNIAQQQDTLELSPWYSDGIGGTTPLILSAGDTLPINYIYNPSEILPCLELQTSRTFISTLSVSQALTTINLTSYFNDLIGTFSNPPSPYTRISNYYNSSLAGCIITITLTGTPPINTLVLTNHAEVKKVDLFEDKIGSSYLGISGLLSGYNYTTKAVSTVSSSNSPISGIIDYRTGNLKLDLSNISTFLGDASVGAQFWFNTTLPGTLNTLGSANYVYLSSNVDYSLFTLSTYFESTILQTSVDFYRKQEYLKEIDNNLNTVLLSNVYKIGNTGNTFQTTDPTNTYYKLKLPRYTLNIDNITNVGELIVSGDTFSYLPTNNTPYTIQSTNADNNAVILLSSNSTTSKTYNVSCYDSDKPYIGYNVYKFNYKNVDASSEQINIRSDALTLTSELIKMYKQITIDNGESIQQVDLNKNIEVDIKNTVYPYTMAVTAYSGLDITLGDVDTSPNKVALISYPFTGETGLLSTIYETPIKYIYGIDNLILKYPNNAKYIYSLTAKEVDNPSISGIYTFQMYEPTSSIKILNTDSLDFEVKEITATCWDTHFGSYTTLHKFNKVKWNINNANSTLYNTDGSIYNDDEFSLTDTIIAKISTDTFDNINTFPTRIDIAIQANVYNTFENNVIWLTSDTINVSCENFPDASIFNSFLQVNNTSSIEFSEMYRTGATYPITAYDISEVDIGSNVLESAGSTIIYWGDNTSNTYIGGNISGIKTYTSYNDYSIILERKNVKVSNWLSPHSLRSQIDLHLINNIPTATFNMFPKYVITGIGGFHLNTIPGNIITSGVSSYDAGHTETFYLCATDTSQSDYRWYISDDTVLATGNLTSYDINEMTPTSGYPVELAIFTSDLPDSMEQYQRRDSDGVLVKYDNFKTTDDSTIYFQNIRMLNYTSPIINIDSYSDNLFITNNVLITASDEINYDTSKLSEEYSSTYLWELSTPKWVSNGNSSNFNKTIILGKDDSIIGTIRYGATYPINLSINHISYSQIPNNDSLTNNPKDWGIKPVLSYDTVSISYTAVPELLYSVSAENNNYIINNPITFINNTLSTDYMSGFYLKIGDQVSPFINKYNNYDFTFTDTGTYTLEITAVLTNNLNQEVRYTDSLQDFITIEYQDYSFDSDVNRIYGVTVLELPYNYNKTKISINEWVTSDNINKSLTYLYNNLEYLKNMSKFYQLPPIAYRGWFGNTTEVDTRWFNNNYYVSDEYAINNIFTNIKDIKYKNNLLYLIDNNAIKIYRDTNLLVVKSKKTFDEPFVNINAISLDKDDKIYILDSTTNKVMVLEKYKDNDSTPIKFIIEWGGLGGPNAKQKFYTPNDLIVDKDNNVWVADTGNKVIKKYTKTGSWLMTIFSNKIESTNINTGGIISIDLDHNNDLHVLTYNKVHKFDSKGNYILSYDIETNGEIPTRIRTMEDSGFMYISLNTSIIKVRSENGAYSGIIGNERFNKNFKSICHINKELFIANTIDVIKYAEYNKINQVYIDALNLYDWSLEDILINSNSFTQDWVINLAYKRLLDNINLYIRSLLGKINVTTTNGISKIIIDSFTIEEYTDLIAIDSDQIFIGINELLTADVLNRGIKILFDKLDNIRKLI